MLYAHTQIMHMHLVTVAVEYSEAVVAPVVAVATWRSCSWPDSEAGSHAEPIGVVGNGGRLDI